MACNNCNKNNQRSTGLGDTIKNLADALGIRQCSGCAKRQRILNDILPYNRKGR